jgi:hypothetical protein
MRQPSTEHGHRGQAVSEPVFGNSTFVPNPEVLWRRTAGSVVVLPPGGEPTELIGPAATVWDRVVTPGDEPSVQLIDVTEIAQIVDAFLEMDLVMVS